MPAPGPLAAGPDTHGAGGLDEAEARRRLAEIGPNVLPQARRRTPASILFGALREPMFGLVLAAAGLYFLLGDRGEGLFLLVGVGVTIGLAVSQEMRGERALAALRALAEPQARVVRGGRERSVPARDLVPGDLLRVGEGQRLAADCRLVGGDMLGVDESALTGESATVLKRPGDDGDEGRLLTGSLVVSGQATAEVVLTGARTALGRIGGALAGMSEEPTPLQRASGRLVRLLGLGAVVFCGVVALAYGLTRHDWMEAVLAGVTFAIALIPEEFPMILTGFLALGGWRLARHQVLVRRAAAVEALGGVTLLCVDKTGTLTESRMQLVRAATEGREFRLPEEARTPAVAKLLRSAARACVDTSIDAMDRAVLGMAPPASGRPARSWPLRPERPLVVQLWREDEGWFAAAKGAPEAVLRLCRLPDAQAEVLLRRVERLAEDGLRVLAVATWRSTGPFPDDPSEAAFAYEGLLGFLDPLSADAAGALEQARAAGIGVAMITGDHPTTALAVARQARLDVSAGLLTGRDIAALPAAELQERLRTVRLFARITPEQKLRLIEGFKALGQITAMTGDGVNDAPALEAAHIGVAMGGRGTDVAREAADIVLLDDRFASIIGGVRLGRRIFANLQRALTYVTAIHVPIAGVALAPVLLNLPPLLFPLHVVLLELAVDPTCALVFEAEPSAPDAMRRPPRPPSLALFGARQVIFALLQGLGVFLLVLALYAWGLSEATEDQARGAAFLALIGGNLVLGLVDSVASYRIFAPQRRVYWMIVLLMSGLVAAVFFLPQAAALFLIAPPPPALAGAAAGAVALSGLWGGLTRWAGRRAPAAAGPVSG